MIFENASAAYGRPIHSLEDIYHFSACANITDKILKAESSVDTYGKFISYIMGDKNSCFVKDYVYERTSEKQIKEIQEDITFENRKRLYTSFPHSNIDKFKPYCDIAVEKILEISDEVSIYSNNESYEDLDFFNTDLLDNFKNKGGLINLVKPQIRFPREEYYGLKFEKGFILKVNPEFMKSRVGLDTRRKIDFFYKTLVKREKYFDMINIDCNSND